MAFRYSFATFTPSRESTRIARVAILPFSSSGVTSNVLTLPLLPHWLPRTLLTHEPHVIQQQEPYHELGANYFDQKQPEVTTQKLVKRLERMGYQVTLQSQATSVA